MLLEVCCADIESVRAAKEGGAQRVELCADLEADGLTPSEELIAEALKTGITVHVLIRCRAGNFVYNEAELAEMEESVSMVRRLGGHGVVIGALTVDGDIDIEACQRLVARAGEMNITFHRAFDVCRNPLTAINGIMQLGCNRLLTSGQMPSAMEGAQLIHKLVDISRVWQQTSGHDFIIMPGAGVNAHNIGRLLSETGACEAHGSLRSMVNGRMQTTADNVRQALRNATN